MKSEKPLVDKKCLMEKIPGKGGWTYVRIPEVLQNKYAPFGWVRVKGSIDNYELTAYKLMPMGNGQLFLPVRAEIRKKIGKQEGDYVHIILYADDIPTELTKELKECFLEEPKAYNTFLSYPESEQKKMIEWIYSARTEDEKAERIVKTIERLSIELKGE